MEISSRAVLPVSAEDDPAVNDGDSCCEDVGSNLSPDERYVACVGVFKTNNDLKTLFCLKKAR